MTPWKASVAALLLMAGCIQDAADPAPEAGLPVAEDILVTPFEQNLVVPVPANATAVLSIHLTDAVTQGTGYMFLGVASASTGDASVGFAVRLQRDDEERISYHPMGIPGDGSGWATRAMGSIRGTPDFLNPAQVLLLLSAEADATFTVGVIHFDDYEKRYRAAESLRGRPVVEVQPDAWAQPFRAGTHWSIADGEGTQEWKAGTLELTTAATATGDQTSWSMPFVGPIAAEAVYWRPAGAVDWNVRAGPEEQEGRFAYTSTPGDAAVVRGSAILPGVDSAGFHVFCKLCQHGTAEGRFSFAGTMEHDDPVVATIVTAGELPQVDWEDFGWPPPMEWVSIREGNGFSVPVAAATSAATWQPATR